MTARIYSAEDLLETLRLAKSLAEVRKVARMAQMRNHMADPDFANRVKAIAESKIAEMGVATGPRAHNVTTAEFNDMNNILSEWSSLNKWAVRSVQNGRAL